MSKKKKSARKNTSYGMEEYSDYYDGDDWDTHLKLDKKTENRKERNKNKEILRQWYDLTR